MSRRRKLTGAEREDRERRWLLRRAEWRARTVRRDWAIIREQLDPTPPETATKH